MALNESVLSYPAAWQMVAAHTAALAPPATETVAIHQASDRCLASAILADRDQPPFDRSTRDGFALRAADLQLGTLKVVGQLRAGEPPFAGTIGPGEALEIMTGAPLPSGANAVLMVEHTGPSAPTSTGGTGATSISIQPGRGLLPGENVVPSGAEARRGATLIPTGTRLTAAHIGAAVSAGATSATVYVRPRVAILATGDELVEPGESLLNHQIRNSNSYSLAAQVERAGGVAVRLPIVRDSLYALQEAIEQALQADLLLLSGGVSMGKFDFVEQVLLSLHAELLFTGVRMQPGKPLVFGRFPHTGKYFYGLPGNPVSTMVTFTLFAAPLLRSLGGEHHARPLFAQARLAEGFTQKCGTTRFLPALLEADWQGATVRLIAWQGSGDVAATARANCFAVIPPDLEHVEAGASVAILLGT